jgi:endonuclease/exonuclease/phosphatase family metal-dependent hydrolase
MVVAVPPLAQPVDVAAPGMVVATWNVGLDDADLGYIADELTAFSGVDIWLIQEARGDGTFDALTQAAGYGEEDSYVSVAGTTGADIPLLTIYNDARFDLLGWEELHDINTTGNARAPLVLHLVDTETGVEFLVVNNHLYRSREEERDRQATLLNEWAQTQTLPIVEGGDHNFDYDVPDGPSASDRGFDNMTAGGVWQWVEPKDLVPTQCTDNLPCTYDDVLDFIFVAGPAREWPATSQVIVRDGDFPDDGIKSDHRPVAAYLGVSAPDVAVASRASTVEVAGATANRNANLRDGPGTEFEIAGSVATGQAVDIAGVNPAGDWYRLASGLWIAAFLVDNAPDQALLPKVQSLSTAEAVRSSSASSGSTSGLSEPAPTVTPLPQASSLLTVIAVNPEDEYAIIQNTGGTAVDLNGWTLRSERGVQDCPLQGVLEPGDTLTISALGDMPGFNCRFKSNIWNNREPDAAVLISPDGREVSRME